MNFLTQKIIVNRLYKCLKKKIGVYIFVIEDGSSYVGSSLSLYNRLQTYFQKSVVERGTRRVLKYFNEYGYHKNIKLILYVLDKESSIDNCLDLEQYLINSLKPNLNIALYASTPGPYSQDLKELFRESRGRKVFIYDTFQAKLVFIRKSVQYITDYVGIHRQSILRYTCNGQLYLKRFIISYDVITEINNEKLDILDKEEFKILLFKARLEHDKARIQPRARPILCENVIKPYLSKIYPSLNAFSVDVKGDRQTIRKYLRLGTGLYRKQ